MIIEEVHGTILMDIDGNVDLSVTKEIFDRILAEHYTGNNPFELDGDDDGDEGQCKGMTDDQAIGLITEVANHVIRRIQASGGASVQSR